MMHSVRSHSIQIHRYDMRFHSETIPRPDSYPRIGLLEHHPRPHLTAFLSADDSAERIFHKSISEVKRSTGGFKFMDDNYLVIESFLRDQFKKKQSLSAASIANALAMDYGEVREVLAMMIKEGKLGVK